MTGYAIGSGAVIPLTPAMFDDMVETRRRINAKFPAPVYNPNVAATKTKMDAATGTVSVEGINAEDFYEKLYTPQLGSLYQHTFAPIKSDGGQTDYYRLPPHATELRHLISFAGMSKSRGDIFKACWRIGQKDGNTILYDLNKMKFFVEDLLEMHRRGEFI